MNGLMAGGVAVSCQRERAQNKAAHAQYGKVRTPFEDESGARKWVCGALVTAPGCLVTVLCRIQQQQLPGEEDFTGKK